MKNDIRIIGDLNWTQLRQLIIDQMEGCRTKREFEDCMMILWKSVGTKEHIIAVRKELGLKPLTKEELKEMEKQ